MVKISEADGSEHSKLDPVGFEVKEILEFPKTSEYKEVTFPIANRKGKWDITFVFLPGSDFDFKTFRFM